ncbi:MAG: OFA family MFS transporter [Phycisphaerales bacterium]|nr:OFA family MFS transporter [Phycisphaerales bacterium]
MSDARSSVASPPMTRWFVLIGALMIQLILGTLYGYSIFWEPLQPIVFPPDAAWAGSEATVAQRTAAEQGALKYAFSICILAFAGTMVFAGRVQDVHGPRVTAIIGGVLIGAGFLLAGLMQYEAVYYVAHVGLVAGVLLMLLLISEAVFGRSATSESAVVRNLPWVLFCAVTVAGVLVGVQYVGKLGTVDRLLLLWGTVGLLAGAGIGFAYVCPIAALIKWFPQQKGLVAGVAVAGFGFGAYVFALRGWELGALGFIQAYGIERFFLVHAAVCCAIIALGALLLRNPPGSVTVRGAVESDWRGTLRRPAFYILWMMYFSGALAGLMVIAIVMPFAGAQLVAANPGADEELRAALLLRGAAAVGWLAIFNAVGRIVWGLISDRVGRTPAFVAMFTFQAVVMFLLGYAQTELTLAVGAALVGFNYGGCFALFPSATADLFGAKNLGANYGWVFTSYGIAGLVGVTAGNAALARTQSYTAAFALAGVLCLLSAVLAIGLHVGRQRANLPSTAPAPA